MTMRSERGEGSRLQSFIWLAIFGLVVYAGWNVVPIYIAQYSLADKVNQICRTPRNVKDEQLVDMMMKEVVEHRLDPYIQKSCFKIQTLDTSRRINCEYQREGVVLPGWTRTFRFRIAADQPLIF
jgi:hypothetical protein